MKLEQIRLLTYAYYISWNLSFAGWNNIVDGIICGVYIACKNNRGMWLRKKKGNWNKPHFSPPFSPWCGICSQDKLLVSAKCCILDVYSKDFCDSHVLSESRLFVFEWKLIFKTCGKTTLLHLVRDMCIKLGTLYVAHYKSSLLCFQNHEAFATDCNVSRI